MGLQILLVDGDESALGQLRQMLTDLGHHVVGQMSNGADSVELCQVRSMKPDLILMDVDIPMLTALHAMSQLRKIQPTARIILMTKTNAPVEEIRQVGALGVLRKPCHPETVKSILGQFEVFRRTEQTRLHAVPKVAVKVRK